MGGTVTGLSSSVVLANGVDQLTVSRNGAFVFTNKVASGQSYSVSVFTQPSAPTQTCTVTSGDGNTKGDVTNVRVDCPPFVVSSGLVGPSTLRVNGSNLYFATSSPVSCYGSGTPRDSIMMVPATGGKPTPIAPVNHYAGNCGAYGIVFDSTYVYWANYADATVFKATLAGTSPQQIFSGGQYMNGLAIDAAGGYLFYHVYPNSSIGRISTAGSGNTMFATAGSINGENLATDASNLYWTDATAGTVNQVPLNSSSLPASPTAIATGEAIPFSPFVTPTTIYWLTSGNPGALRYSALTSPSASSVGSPLASPGSVVADSFAAWVVASGASASDGRVYKISLPSGTTEIVAQGLYQPSAIAMDAGHIYWVTNNTAGNVDGTVMMIVK